jgi:hypothetical protein
LRWKKLHELFVWDERQIFSFLEGAKMAGTHSDEEWGRILAAHRSPPGPPPVRVSLGDSAIALQPTESAGQLELGAIALRMSDWRISNARDVIDPGLPFRLRPALGVEAFTKLNSWRRRIYEAPMLLRRDDQRYVGGWDGFRAALSADPDRIYSVGELSRIGEMAIAATLTVKEANDFWMARR